MLLKLPSNTHDAEELTTPSPPPDSDPWTPQTNKDVDRVLRDAEISERSSEEAVAVGPKQDHCGGGIEAFFTDSLEDSFPNHSLTCGYFSGSKSSLLKRRATPFCQGTHAKSA